MERLLERARHLRGLEHRRRPFGDRLGDGLDVHGLEILLVQPRARRLAGDAEDRNRVGLRRVQAGDHVGARGPGGADAHADVARRGARVAFGHVRCALDVAREDVRNAAARLQRRVQRIDRGAGNAERVGDTFPFEHVHGGIDRSHLGHGLFPPGVRRLAGGMTSILSLRERADKGADPPVIRYL